MITISYIHCLKRINPKYFDLCPVEEVRERLYTLEYYTLSIYTNSVYRAKVAECTTNKKRNEKTEFSLIQVKYILNAQS